MFYRAIDKNLESTIGYARLEGPTKVVVRLDHPVIIRTDPCETKGVEDPRIVKLDDTYYLTYTAHDGKHAVLGYATSSDLRVFTKGGIISPKITYDEVGKILQDQNLKDQYRMFEAFYEEFAARDVYLWEKDGILFPKRINGKYALLHRILPDIHIIYFDDFEQLQSRDYWISYLENLKQHVVLENKYRFESRHIGGGAPPIETDDGWLFIFHSTEESNKGRIYHASAALLDIHNPTKVIGRLNYPLISPSQKMETTGFVNNVVFPTGTAQFGEDLYIYYGAADKVVAVAKVHFSSLIDELKRLGVQ